jgi:hypothetical protein
MKKLTLGTLAWALPALYLVHLLEEFYAGERFPVWFSRVLGANLSDSDFILINSVGISVFILSAVVYALTKRNGLMVISLATVLFLNGFVHFFSSIFSLSYSPGTISGLLLYLPMGFFLFKKVEPPLRPQERNTGLMIGVLVHIGVALLALNI